MCPGMTYMPGFAAKTKRQHRPFLRQKCYAASATSHKPTWRCFGQLMDPRTRRSPDMPRAGSAGAGARNKSDARILKEDGHMTAIAQTIALAAISSMIRWRRHPAAHCPEPGRVAPRPGQQALYAG
jgi:hypothetical protein